MANNIKKLRILIVSEPGLDGVFRHVEGLIDYLHDATDHVIDLAYSSIRSSDRLNHLIARVEQSGGTTIDLKTGNAPSAPDISAVRKLLQIIKAKNPAVIHAHSSKAGALIRLLPQVSSKRIIYTPHAYYGMGPSTGIKVCAFNSIERLLGYRGTSLHVSSEEMNFGTAALKLPTQNRTVIPNAVDFNVFRPAEGPIQRDEIRASLGLKEEDIIIGTIGRICDQKDPATLLHAFKHFTETVPDRQVKLLHVGNGPEDEVAALNQISKDLGIQQLVHRPPYRSNPVDFYCAMDAFCLSSRYEGLPFTALEALAVNLPLILTDVPGLRSFRSDHYQFNHVYYGQMENPASLGEAMGSWYQKRHLPCNHREYAKDHFSIHSVYQQIVQLYETQSNR